MLTPLMVGWLLVILEVGHLVSHSLGPPESPHILADANMKDYVAPTQKD